MGRIVGGLAAGIVVFLLVLGGMELLAHQVSPREASGSMLAIVAAAYFLSAMAGGYVAARVARRSWAAWAIALVVAAGAVWSLLQFSHPVWMQLASVVAPLLGGYVAVRLAGTPAPARASGDAA